MSGFKINSAHASDKLDQGWNKRGTQAINLNHVFLLRPDQGQTMTAVYPAGAIRIDESPACP